MQHFAALLTASTALVGCISSQGHPPVEWTVGRGNPAELAHYKAYAADSFGNGGWSSGVSDPWSAVTYAVRNCQELSGVGARCRIKYLGEASVERLNANEMIAAIFKYHANDSASFDTLDNVAEIAAANQRDGVESVAAMAVVPQQGRRYWALELGDDFEDAERAALSTCGHKDCVVTETYIGGSCGIVVAGDTQIFWASGPEYTLGELMDLCMTESSHCEPVKTVCPKKARE